jgi:hypothetical protein
MFGFIRNKRLGIKYTGYDINKNLISTGKRAYPKAALFHEDYLAKKRPKKFEYIVSSGVHNLKLKNNWAFVERTFEVFDRGATCGFAMNFLSDKVEYRLEDTFHANPEKILALGYKYSRRVVLRNDYMPFEFTLFVDKRQEFDKKKTVFKDFEEYLRHD